MTSVWQIYSVYCLPEVIIFVSESLEDAQSVSAAFQPPTESYHILHNTPLEQGQCMLAWQKCSTSGEMREEPGATAPITALFYISSVRLS